ncbi:MAG: iron ABC transporter permease [Acidobacteria bacterium]|nr:iron ABC transporter permease [Acidobacteriota bacterium]
MKQKLTPGIVLLLLALVLWGYVVGPMVSTFRQSITGEGGAFRGYARFFDFASGAQGEAMLGSLFISILSVITAGITGVFLAVLLSRWDFPLKKVCRVIALAPIALPPLMGVEAFVLLYGVGGTFPQVLGELFQTSPNTFAVTGMPGVLLVHTLTMYPYFYLSVAAALAQSDDSLEEAAYSLGASKFHTWTRVLLPMLTPAVVSGALLTFMSSMASYTAPLLFGVDRVMTTQIVNAKLNGDLRFASVVSVMLGAISIFFLIVIRAYERRTVYRTQSKGGARKRSQVTSPLAKAAVFIVAAASTIFLALPIAMIFVLAFSVNGSWRTSPLPSRYTLQNFVTLFSDPASLDPIENSLVMSAIAVAGTILLGVACAYAITRMRFRGRAAVDIAMMLPWALPGTVVAINLIIAFANPSAFSLGRVLIGTYAMVPLAYFVRFSPLVFRSTTASLEQMDPALEEAARSLGASWWYAFRRVVLPLLYRGIAAGALLAFVSGVGEFVATILIYSPRYRPLSIAINDELYLANYGTAASFGVVQVVLVLLAVIVSGRIEDRNKLVKV